MIMLRHAVSAGRLCEPDFEIIVAKSETEYKVYTLKELLPEGFGRANLQ